MKKIKLLIIISIISLLLYLGYKLIGVRSFYALKTIIKIRIPKVLAIIIASGLVSISSYVFMVITDNRILTPSMLGFDSIYQGVHTLFIFIFGSISILNIPIYNFLISMVFMVGIVLILYKLVLNKKKNNLLFLLLIGLVVSTFISSFISFIQSLMSPDEYLALASSMTVSLTNIEEELIYISLPIFIILMVLFFRENKKYEVLQLGKDLSINLGIDYVKEVNKNLIYIAVAVSLATALVGPLSYLGLITVNIARERLKSFNSKLNMIYSFLMGCIFIFLGSIIIDFIGLNTTISMIINLAGGIYLIYIILKENKL